MLCSCQTGEFTSIPTLSASCQVRFTNIITFFRMFLSSPRLANHWPVLQSPTETHFLSQFWHVLMSFRFLNSNNIINQNLMVCYSISHEGALESNSDNLSTCLQFSAETIFNLPILTLYLTGINHSNGLCFLFSVLLWKPLGSKQLVFASYPQCSWNHNWHTVASLCMFTDWMSAMKTFWPRDHL